VKIIYILWRELAIFRQNIAIFSPNMVKPQKSDLSEGVSSWFYIIEILMVVFDMIL